MEENEIRLNLFWVLQIIFVVLKITEIVTWSWWVVFIPTFVQIGIFIIALLVLDMLTRL